MWTRETTILIVGTPIGINSKNSTQEAKSGSLVCMLYTDCSDLFVLHTEQQQEIENGLHSITSMFFTDPLLP